MDKPVEPKFHGKDREFECPFCEEPMQEVSPTRLKCDECGEMALDEWLRENRSKATQQWDGEV